MRSAGFAAPITTNEPTRIACLMTTLDVVLGCSAAASRVLGGHLRRRAQALPIDDGRPKQNQRRLSDSLVGERLFEPAGDDLTLPTKLSAGTLLAASFGPQSPPKCRRRDNLSRHGALQRAAAGTQRIAEPCGRFEHGCVAIRNLMYPTRYARTLICCLKIGEFDQNFQKNLFECNQDSWRCSWAPFRECSECCGAWPRLSARPSATRTYTDFIVSRYRATES
jgi:hypothetical protein